jgi:hypothetical protein
MQLAGRSGGPWLGELQRQLLEAVLEDPALNTAEALTDLGLVMVQRENDPPRRHEDTK